VGVERDEQETDGLARDGRNPVDGRMLEDRFQATADRAPDSEEELLKVMLRNLEHDAAKLFRRIQGIIRYGLSFSCPRACRKKGKRRA